jgi:hypothetical protein
MVATKLSSFTMDDSHTVEAQKPLDQKGKLTRTHLYILLAILSLAIICLCGYIIWDSNKESTERKACITTTSSETTEEESTTSDNTQEDDSDTEEIDTTTWVTYMSSYGTGEKFAYECPSDWEFVSSEQPGTSVSFASCTSNSGSVFKHYMDPSMQDYRYTCREDSGDVKIEGTSYMRHYDEDSGEWYVCSRWSDETDYTFMPSDADAIAIFAANSGDLPYLDAIIKTVRHVSDNFLAVTAIYYGDGSSISSEYSDYAWFRTCDTETSSCTHYLIEKEQAEAFEDYTDENLNREFVLEGTTTAGGGAAAGNTYILFGEITKLKLVQ